MAHITDVLRRPVLTEKSMKLMQEENKYTFFVDTKSNKTEIKQAVEEIFEGVEVKKVNVANYDGKLKRMGRNIGRRAAYKKAIITLSQDSKPIEFFENL